MTTPSWPATLPQSLDVQGFQQSMPDNLLRSSMDIGPAKVRRRTIANTGSVQGGMVLTGAEIETLRTFYAVTLGEAGRFAWTDPVSGAARQFRFAQAPGWTALGGGLYRASLQLEVLP